MDIGTVDELLSTTRSVRKRLDLTRPVGRDVILECIQLAMQAPTGSNAQDWRWLVVTDAGKRAAIADIYRSIGADYLAYAADNASDPQTQRDELDRDVGPSSGARHPLPGPPLR
jgi:nitroreductase